MNFKITEIAQEEIRNHLGAMEMTETLVCSVTIDGITKSVRFHWSQRSNYYVSQDRNIVYVRIPQYGTERAYTNDVSKLWTNKVRGARLYIQKTELEYKLIPNYKVLDGIAYIESWTDGVRGLELEKQRAADSEIPTPYLEKQENRTFNIGE